MDTLKVSHELAEIVRRERNIETMVGDLLRAFHGELGCNVSAIHLHAAGTGSYKAAVRGAPEERIDQYRTEAAGQALDPLLAEATLRRAPVHNRLLFPGNAWENHPFHRTNSARFGTVHYLVLPILGETSVIGAVHLCRGRHGRAFTDTDLHFGAITAARLALAFIARERSVRDLPRLPVRELQVARLAADGMNNLEIALRLGLARETVKKTLRRAYLRLEVRSRAQLSAKLARAGLL